MPKNTLPGEIVERETTGQSIIDLYDIYAQFSAESKTTLKPPSDVEQGDTYIVPLEGGAVQYSLSFPNEKSYLELENRSPWNSWTGSDVWCAEWYAQLYDSRQTLLFGRNNNDNTGLLVRVREDGTLKIKIDDENNYHEVEFDVSEIYDDEYHRISVVKDGDGVSDAFRVFVDGSEISLEPGGTINEIDEYLSGPIYVGDPNGNSNLDGKIAEFRLSDGVPYWIEDGYDSEMANRLATGAEPALRDGVCLWLNDNLNDRTPRNVSVIDGTSASTEYVSAQVMDVAYNYAGRYDGTSYAWGDADNQLDLTDSFSISVKLYIEENSNHSYFCPAVLADGGYLSAQCGIYIEENRWGAIIDGTEYMTSGSLPRGERLDLAVTWDGSAVKAYKNNDLMFEQSRSDSITEEGTQFSIVTDRTEDRDDYSLHFDKTDENYIDTEYKPLETDVGDGFTFETFVNIEQIQHSGGDFTIHGCGVRVSGNQLFFRLERGHSTGNDYWRFGIGDTSDYYDADVSENTWYHVAVTYDGTTGKMFVDGDKVGEFDATFSGDSDISMQIGNVADTSGNYLDGNIQEFRLWDYVRSENELERFSNRRLDGSESGLLVYCPLTEGSGDDTIEKVTDTYRTIENGTNWSTDTTINMNFRGWIDEVRVWNYARAQTEVKNDRYNELEEEPGLVGYWRNNEGRGNYLVDNSGSENGGPTQLDYSGGWTSVEWNINMGEWENRNGLIALADIDTEGGWRYYPPMLGMVGYIEDEDSWYAFDGEIWRPIGEEQAEKAAAAARVTLVSTDDDAPTEPTEGDLIYDMRYDSEWLRVWDGENWKLTNPGSSLILYNRMTVDWDRGHSSGNITVENSNLKMEVD